MGVVRKEPRVFVVQRQYRMDEERGSLVPKHDLTPAEPFGRLVFLLSPTANPFTPAAILPDLHAKLEDFCDEDYLLLVGNPVLLALSVAVAADYNNGAVKLLQWNGHRRKYVPVEVLGIFPGTAEGDILGDTEDGEIPEEVTELDESRFNR